MSQRGTRSATTQRVSELEALVSELKQEAQDKAMEDGKKIQQLETKAEQDAKRLKVRFRSINLK